VAPTTPAELARFHAKQGPDLATPLVEQRRPIDKDECWETSLRNQRAADDGLSRPRWCHQHSQLVFEDGILSALLSREKLCIERQVMERRFWPVAGDLRSAAGLQNKILDHLTEFAKEV